MFFVENSLLSCTINVRHQPDSSKLNSFSLCCLPLYYQILKVQYTFYGCEASFIPHFCFIAVQVPNPKNKMSCHHNNKNRNAENSAYIRVQRDAVRTVPLNAPPRSRPPNGSYHKDDVNKEPKLNLCSGEALD